MCIFFNDTATTEIYTLSLHDALPISGVQVPSVAPILAPLAQRQSNGLLIRRFWVRIPGGAHQNATVPRPPGRGTLRSLRSGGQWIANEKLMNRSLGHATT